MRQRSNNNHTSNSRQGSEHRPIRHEKVLTSDGAHLDVQRAGAPGAPTIVLGNGLGGNIYAFRGLIDEFGDRFSFVSWDYRGLFRSTLGRIDRQDVAQHADDLGRVLDRLNVTSAIFIGWSFGVQVLLEYAQNHPERCEGLVSVCGTFESPLSSADGPTRLGRTIRFLSSRRGLLRGGIELVKRQPLLFATARRLRVVSTTMQRARFNELAHEFGDIDLTSYFQALDATQNHDPVAALHALKCPVLLVAGELDPIVSADATRRLAADATHVDLLVIPLATHYVPVEFSEFLNLRFDAFLHEHGLTQMRTSL